MDDELNIENIQNTDDNIPFHSFLPEHPQYHTHKLGVVGHCICMAGTSLNSKVYIFQNNTLANHSVLGVIRKV